MCFMMLWWFMGGFPKVCSKLHGTPIIYYISRICDVFWFSKIVFKQTHYFGCYPVSCLNCKLILVSGQHIPKTDGWSTLCSRVTLSRECMYWPCQRGYLFGELVTYSPAKREVLGSTWPASAVSHCCKYNCKIFLQVWRRILKFNVKLSDTRVLGFFFPWTETHSMYLLYHVTF